MSAPPPPPPPPRAVSPLVTKWWNWELQLATNFGNPCTNGYQSWWLKLGLPNLVCTRLFSKFHLYVLYVKFCNVFRTFPKRYSETCFLSTWMQPWGNVTETFLLGWVMTPCDIAASVLPCWFLCNPFLIEIQAFSFKKMHFDLLLAKCKYWHGPFVWNKVNLLFNS